MDTNVLMIIAQPQIVCDQYPPMPAPRTPRQQWHHGYQIFCNLEPDSILTTDDERRGYYAAMRDCADLDTAAYLAGRSMTR